MSQWQTGLQVDPSLVGGPGGNDALPQETEGNSMDRTRPGVAAVPSFSGLPWELAYQISRKDSRQSSSLGPTNSTGAQSLPPDEHASVDASDDYLPDRAADEMPGMLGVLGRGGLSPDSGIFEDEGATLGGAQAAFSRSKDVSGPGDCSDGQGSDQLSSFSQLPGGSGAALAASPRASQRGQQFQPRGGFAGQPGSGFSLNPSLNPRPLELAASPEVAQRGQMQSRGDLDLSQGQPSGMGQLRQPGIGYGQESLLRGRDPHFAPGALGSGPVSNPNSQPSSRSASPGLSDPRVPDKSSDKLMEKSSPRLLAGSVGGGVLGGGRALERPTFPSLGSQWSPSKRAPQGPKALAAARKGKPARDDPLGPSSSVHLPSLIQQTADRPSNPLVRQPSAVQFSRSQASKGSAFGSKASGSSSGKGVALPAAGGKHSLAIKGASARELLPMDSDQPVYRYVFAMACIALALQNGPMNKVGTK